MKTPRKIRYWKPGFQRRTAWSHVFSQYLHPHQQQPPSWPLQDAGGKPRGFPRRHAPFPFKPFPPTSSSGSTSGSRSSCRGVVSTSALIPNASPSTLPFKLSALSSAKLFPGPRSINAAFLGSITCPPSPCAMDWPKLQRQARLAAAADGGMAGPELFHPLSGGRRRPNSDRTAPQLSMSPPAFLPRPNQVT
jgi:hypothetical protein